MLVEHSNILVIFFNEFFVFSKVLGSLHSHLAEFERVDFFLFVVKVCFLALPSYNVVCLL